MNPHFLFNSLNTLKSMVDFGDENASDFIVKLSDFYRYSLESRQKDVVPIEQELKMLSPYFFLIKSRFEEDISIEIMLSANHNGVLVPTFTLQLLVENAVKHNIISLDQPLHIEIVSDGNRILVRNNLQLKNIPEPSTKIGLENINQRYMHLAGKTITVETSNNFFTVALPVNEYISN
ncbi:sensor histidine kinase [Mucilaginibacter rigui]|uniref:sensor histidine kinase n=1 Tax=Mucilaginibacter rigui TaxID=534635 RepID=UPI00293BEA99|nr:histidine kinase [Mucilaginibacter rigui]